MDQKKQPYTVEVEDEGCERCGSHRMWTIVGPDDCCLGQSFGDKELVDDIVEYLNEAYELGFEAATATPPLRMEPSQ